ncbi:unnamed protein product [Calypogeia fissa]
MEQIMGLMKTVSSSPSQFQQAMKQIVGLIKTVRIVGQMMTHDDESSELAVSCSTYRSSFGMRMEEMELCDHQLVPQGAQMQIEDEAVEIEKRYNDDSSSSTSLVSILNTQVAESARWLSPPPKSQRLRPHFVPWNPDWSERDCHLGRQNSVRSGMSPPPSPSVFALTSSHGTRTGVNLTATSDDAGKADGGNLIGLYRTVDGFLKKEMFCHFSATFEMTALPSLVFW